MRSAPTLSRPTAGLGALRVADAMHHGVVTCSPLTSLLDVARTMAEQRIHFVIVSPESDREPAEHIRGVVSDLDLIAAATTGDLSTQLAASCAATPVLTVTPDETLQRAAQCMTEYGVSHLVVVDAEALRPLGVLSTLDIAAALGDGVRLEELTS